MLSRKVYSVSRRCGRGAGLVNAASLMVLLSGLVFGLIFGLAGCDKGAENSLTNNNGVTQDGLSNPVLVSGFDNSSTEKDDEQINDNIKVPVDIVRYDATTDYLSIRAQDASLTKLLARITLRTGIETWIDEDFDPRVSADIEPQPLEKALKQFLTGINHVMHYGKDQQGKTLITGVEILQAGSESGTGLAIVPIYRQSGMLANRYPSSIMPNFVHQRWQQRLAKMPENQRREVEAHYQKKLEKRDRQIAQRKQRKAESRQKREKRQLERKKRDEALLASDPELYEIRMQKREEMRQKFLNEQRTKN